MAEEHWNYQPSMVAAAQLTCDATVLMLHLHLLHPTVNSLLQVSLYHNDSYLHHFYGPINWHDTNYINLTWCFQVCHGQLTRSPWKTLSPPSVRSLKVSEYTTLPLVQARQCWVISVRRIVWTTDHSDSFFFLKKKTSLFVFSYVIIWRTRTIYLLQ